jgi:N-acetylglucosamine malate deacetylase 1
MEKPSKSVIAFCAHNDDHIIGAGGTLAKYAREGFDVIAVIFSYGELTHPWLQRKVAIKMRVEESRRADRILGMGRVYFFGIQEGKFGIEIRAQKIKQRIKRIIAVIRPEKVFTHSPDDPHPDHREVCRSVTEIMEEIKYSCDVYSFDVWNPFNVRLRDRPRLVVDITKTFGQKVKSLSVHKSQWMARITLTPVVFLRAFLHGLDAGVRYAEVFVKLK